MKLLKMKLLNRLAVVEMAIRQIGKPCLYIKIDWPGGASWTDVLKNAPYLAECGEYTGGGFGLVVCDTMQEAETLLSQTVCDGVKGGVYAVLHNTEGEVESENT